MQEIYMNIPYLKNYSPAGTGPAIGVGEDDTMFNRFCSLTIGSETRKN